MGNTPSDSANLKNALNLDAIINGVTDEDDNVYSGSIQPKSSELHEFIRTQKQKSNARQVTFREEVAEIRLKTELDEMDLIQDLHHTMRFIADLQQFEIGTLNSISVLQDPYVAMNCGLLAETFSEQQLKELNSVKKSPEVTEKIESLQLLHNVLKTWEQKAPQLRVSKEQFQKSRSASPEKRTPSKFPGDSAVSVIFNRNKAGNEQMKQSAGLEKEDGSNSIQKWKELEKKASFEFRKGSEKGKESGSKESLRSSKADGLDKQKETSWRSRAREPFANSEVNYDDTMEQTSEKRYNKDMHQIRESITRSLSRGRSGRKSSRDSSTKNEVAEEEIDKEIDDFKKQINKIKDTSRIPEQQIEKQLSYKNQPKAENPVKRRAFETFQPNYGPEDEVDRSGQAFFPVDPFAIKQTQDLSEKSNRNQSHPKQGVDDQASPRFTHQEDIQDYNGRQEWKNNLPQQQLNGPKRANPEKVKNSGFEYDFHEGADGSQDVYNRNQQLTRNDPTNRDDSEIFQNPILKTVLQSPQKQTNYSSTPKDKLSSKRQGNHEKKDSQYSNGSGVGNSANPREKIFNQNWNKQSPMKNDSRNLKLDSSKTEPYNFGQPSPGSQNKNINQNFQNNQADYSNKRYNTDNYPNSLQNYQQQHSNQYQPLENFTPEEDFKIIPRNNHVNGVDQKQYNNVSKSYQVPYSQPYQYEGEPQNHFHKYPNQIQQPPYSQNHIGQNQSGQRARPNGLQPIIIQSLPTWNSRHQENLQLELDDEELSPITLELKLENILSDPAEDPTASLNRTLSTGYVATDHDNPRNGFLLADDGPRDTAQRTKLPQKSFESPYDQKYPTKKFQGYEDSQYYTPQSQEKPELQQRNGFPSSNLSPIRKQQQPQNYDNPQYSYINSNPQDLSANSTRSQGFSTNKPPESQNKSQRVFNQAPYDLYEEAQSIARPTNNKTLNISQNSTNDFSSQNKTAKANLQLYMSSQLSGRSFPVRNKLDQELEELNTKVERLSPMKASNRSIVIPTDGENHFKIKEIRNPIFDNKKKLNGVNTSSVEFRDISTTPGLMQIPNRTVTPGSNSTGSMVKRLAVTPSASTSINFRY